MELSIELESAWSNLVEPQVYVLEKAFQRPGTGTLNHLEAPLRRMLPLSEVHCDSALL